MHGDPSRGIDPIPGGDWGFESRKRGLGTELKFGLGLVFVLLCAFGIVVYQKVNDNPLNQAYAEGNSKTPATSPLGTPESQVNQPASHLVNTPEPALADQGEPTLVSQTEPGSGLPVLSIPGGSENTVTSQNEPEATFAPFDDPAAETSTEPPAFEEVASAPAETIPEPAAADPFQGLGGSALLTEAAADPAATIDGGATEEPVTEPTPFPAVEEPPITGFEPAVEVAETSAEPLPEPETSSEDVPFFPAPPETEPEPLMSEPEAVPELAFPGELPAPETAAPAPESTPPTIVLTPEPAAEDVPLFPAPEMEPQPESPPVAETGEAPVLDLFPEPETTPVPPTVEVVEPAEPPTFPTPVETVEDPAFPTPAPVVETEQPAFLPEPTPEVDRTRNEGLAAGEPEFLPPRSTGDQPEMALDPPEPTESVAQVDDGNPFAPLPVPEIGPTADPAPLPIPEPEPTLTLEPTPDPVETVTPEPDTGLFPPVEPPTIDTPGPTPTPVANTGQGQGGDVYEVQPGDNYWTISRKVYGSPIYFMALHQHNKSRVPNPQHLRPGMKVMTPTASTLETKYRSSFPQGALAKSPTTPAANGPRPAKKQGFMVTADGPVYVIGADDTLTGIAHKHLGRASRWVQIYEMNREKLPNPDRLQIGTVIKLPADASRVSVAPSVTGNR